MPYRHHCDNRYESPCNHGNRYTTSITTVTHIKRVCRIPVEVDDIFVDTLKDFVESSEDFDVVLAEFIVNVL